MKNLQIQLHDEMFLELIDAAAGVYQVDERTVTPEEFAAECVESALATRRLDRLTLIR